MLRIPALYQRRSGTLEFHADQVEFVAERGEEWEGEESSPVAAERYTLPYQYMHLELGGENSQLYVIKDLRNPTVTLSFQDRNALKILIDLGKVPLASQVLKKSQVKRKLKWVKVSSPLIAIPVLLLLIPSLISLIPLKWLEGVLSLEQEKKLSTLILSSDRDLGGRSPKALPQEQSLLKLVGFLQDANPNLAKIPFEVRISPESEVNAYAMPGGILIFNQGLLNRAESIEEVLGVLAHEMAHVERRHGIKSLAGRLGQLAGTVMISFILGPDASNWFRHGIQFVSLKYSREDETEADTLAHQFLAEARVDPMGFVTFFQRLADESSLRPLNGLLALASTHPESQQRYENIKNLFRKTPYPVEKRFPVRLEDLKNPNP